VVARTLAEPYLRVMAPFSGSELFCPSCGRACPTFHVSDVVVVFACSNPVYQEGTFELPESSIDRFAIEIDMRYVGRQDEIDLLKAAPTNRVAAGAQISKPIQLDEILQTRREIAKLLG
jgi:MoxR-like ATPase